MSDNVIPFDRGHFITGGDGSGPEDPMLEQRVGRLEERLGRIETILTSLGSNVTEILLTSAKQSDVSGVRLELAELKGKVSTLPTTWQMYSALIGAVVAAVVAVSGLIFTILRFSKP